MKIDKKLFWIFAISSAVYFTQGIEGLPGMALFFFLKEQLHFTPEKIMYLGSLVGLAWLIKPLWGYLCDNLLSKKSWMVISLVSSSLIALYFGFSSFLPISLLIGILMLSGWTGAIRDVAVDGIMCVEGKALDECGRIQAIQWTAITLASIIVGIIGGWIADHSTYKIGYLCLIPVYLIIISIVSKYKAEKNISKTKQSTLRTIVSYKELFTNKKFLWTCLFIFLFNFNPSFGTPLMFIERDVFKWSGTFMGILGAICSSVGILGSILYFKFGKSIDIKKCLIFSVFLGSLTTLAYLYFTPISAIVYGIVFSLIGQFISLIILSWMAKCTIDGKEATSFALLCSVSNLAGTASTISGAWLFPRIGLSPLIIVSALTSFLCLFIINRLEISNAK